MTALILAALLISLIELEADAAGQFMLSRPLILGPVMGLAFHRFDFGAGIGALMEMFSFESLPVGGNIPPNATVAAAGVLLLALGASPVPPELAFPAGLCLGWLYSRLDVSVRRRRARFNEMADARLRRGEDLGLGGIMRRAMAEHFLANALVLLSAVLLVRPLLVAAWPGVPVAVKAALYSGFRFAPWLGAGALSRILWPR